MIISRAEQHIRQILASDYRIDILYGKDKVTGEIQRNYSYCC